MSRALLVFSGHNMRAVVTLCRAMTRLRLPFHIVANGADDPIFNTDWAAHTILTRQDASVTLTLFAAIRAAAPAGVELLYCPTTEFINFFVLQNRSAVEAQGVLVRLPEAALYARLSNKSSSPEFIQALTGIAAPPELDWHAAHAPCVVKPRANIASAAAHYPVICLDEAALQRARAQTSPEHWFIQRYINGQSHYLCGYLARDGRNIAYWQTNLLQQANGKSIVLARTGNNPGLDEGNFFRALAASGYHGPLMLEFIQEPDGALHYIETNPRFWGPLQLAEDACPGLLELYASDSGLTSTAAARSPPRPGPHWYAWFKGAQSPDCRTYPEAAELSAAELEQLLQQHDVYARPDTAALSGQI